ncbi:DEAD/DEAH box helicase [Leisingera aquaemixtae]|uniref:DEAD/DEAH box helicase n=1 Tax=Leisingera aquaemixtae TaxID=1396826 RepID=A0ABY5WEN4_9RHOB|nr:DEAD/DEAH box helicase [Leisingera aquaemixtae]UWQ39924.1 DEAD/DEAH box helicase [Leisingera aquaemixtae]
MNPILLNNEVMQGFRDLLRGTFTMSSPHFKGMLENFMARPDTFLKGPWISAGMPFRPGNDEEPFPHVPLGFRPHLHQQMAFDRLGGEAPKSTLVATGTGSGKTESYLWPILDMCRRHKTEPGVKAILIYPMNALAQDQARRIAKAIHRTPELTGVRAGIYADARPKAPVVKMTEDSIITSREEMVNAPPDILLTNYKMLDYLLIRGRDRGLWANNLPEALRFLVVDEIHTFDGAQGADLAMLIRRVKSRLKTPAGHLACVGSSATLGDGEEASLALRKYARDVFGEEFDEHSVIREHRLTPDEVFASNLIYDERPDTGKVKAALERARDMDQAEAAAEIAMAIWPDMERPEDPGDIAWRRDLAARLRQTDMAKRVYAALGAAGPAASLPDAAEALRENSFSIKKAYDEKDAEQVISAIVAVTAWARDDQRVTRIEPFLTLRVQNWARELRRMVATLPRINGTGVLTTPELLHFDDIDEDTARRALPVVRCDNCFTAGYLGRLGQNNMSLWADPKTLYDSWFEGSTRLRIIYHDPLEISVGSNTRAVAKGQVCADQITFSFKDTTTDTPEAGPQTPCWIYDPSSEQGNIKRECPHCGARDALYILGMRSARLSSALAGTLFSSRFHEEEDEAKPRMLMFSDSVQDATQRAAVTESRNARWTQARAMWRGIDHSPERALPLKRLITAVPRQLRKTLGDETFVARFISGEMTWRDGYKGLVETGGLQDPSLAEDVEARLSWDVFSDLTWQARRTMSLPGTRLVAIGFAPEAIAAVAEKLPDLLAHEGLQSVAKDASDASFLLWGMLLEMVSRGAVDHPYVRAAQVVSNRSGPNWYGGLRAVDSGYYTRRVLPVFRDASRRALGQPRIPTLRLVANGYEKMAADSATNWYRGWFRRFLARSDNTQKLDQLQSILSGTLKLLQAEGLVDEIHGSDHASPTAWLVRPEAITVSTDVTHLACDRCSRKIAALPGQGEGSPCLRTSCAGTLQADTDDEGYDHLRWFYRHGRDHRVVAREHTGLLDTETRKALEAGFIDGEAAWHPNTISATSTLEMGIDIGDLSTMLLCTVPPKPANFVQRAGRTGRRDGNALNITTVSARQHDLQFWSRPDAMLAGQVDAPGVYLKAPEVLKRQAAAFTLDRFVENAHDTVDFGTVKPVIDAMDSNAPRGSLFLWLEYVDQNGQLLADAFLDLLPEEARAVDRITNAVTAYLTEQEGLRSHVATTFEAVIADRKRLRDMQDDYAAQIKKLKAQKPPPDDRDKIEADLKSEQTVVRKMISETIDKVTILQHLTDSGVLPNYAFPEVGVKLKSFIQKGAGDRKADRDPKDIRSAEYVRPPSSGLTELAPGQIFYVDGRQLKIDQLDIGPDDIGSVRFCPSCSWTEPEIEAVKMADCPRCGSAAWKDVSGKAEVVDLKSVIVFTDEAKAAIRDADERDATIHDRIILPRYGQQQIDAAWTTEDVSPPFGYEFIDACEMHDVNFGERKAAPTGRSIAGQQLASFPFIVCRHCGKTQFPTHDDAAPGEHSRRCPADGGKQPRDQWLKEVFLRRKWRTEALRLVLPVAGDTTDDEMKSFTAAVDLGLKAFFKGAVDHIRSTSLSETIKGTTVRSLYLYDAVPGGSSYLRELATDRASLRQVFSLAQSAIDECACKGLEHSDGCHACVRSYRAQFGPGRASRSLALKLVNRVLASWDHLVEADGSIDGPISGPMGDSALEDRFYQELRERLGTHGSPLEMKEIVTANAKRAWQFKVAGPTGKEYLWRLETQVQINKAFPGQPVKRVDCLLRPPAATKAKPIVVELDGWEHHGPNIASDLRDRLAMIRSEALRVVTLTWADFDEKTATLPPLAAKNAAAAAAMVERLQHIPADHRPALLDLLGLLSSKDETGSRSLKFLLFLLRNPDAAIDILTGNACFALFQQGEPAIFPSELSAESKEFVDFGQYSRQFTQPGARTFIGLPVEARTPAGLHLARVMIHSTLPDSVPDASSNTLPRKDWWHLWTTVTLMQGLDLHVSAPGGHGLEAPASSKASDNDWDKLEDVDDCLDALIGLLREKIPAPDAVGLDLIEGKRVAGNAELAWTRRKIAITLEPFVAEGWTLIDHDPERSDPTALAAIATKIIDHFVAETTR